MRRPLLLSCLLAIGCSPMSGTAQTPAHAFPADGTLLSVSAQAEARRVPDVATLSAGVVTQAADANTALRENAEQMSRVVAAIKAAGIAERDVQTSGISVQPQYRYAENQPPKITGYQASNTVNLKVREIGKLGRVLDALVAQGANQVNGPSFEIDKPEPAYDEARRAALDKAKARAAMYAEALDLRVRRIVSINEGGGGFQPPMPMMRTQAMDAMASKETSVSPGENTLSVSLDVVFELGK
ncbi:MAG TPA: SIMPL domain-containing protein [Xanthomonadaceae bacterium]|nr:SIMPL domain-containing protein [Xanthomonadaceae bacterium]